MERQMMRIPKGKRMFEVHLQRANYFAQAHCVCGSTMSSGESFPTIEKAVMEASSNMDDHESKCTAHHVRRSPLALLAESVGNATSLLEAQLAVSIYVSRIKRQSQAANSGHTTGE